jgi:putative sterol carrier protein
MDVPFTQPWADAFCAAVNADSSYRAASLAWTWPIALVLSDGAPIGVVGPVAIELALDRGTCHTARIISPDAVTAPFVLRAPYPVWKEIMQGGLDPIIAVARGTVTVTGPRATLLLHARSATALLRSAQAVPTRYPDEELQRP